MSYFVSLLAWRLLLSSESVTSVVPARFSVVLAPFSDVLVCVSVDLARFSVVLILYYDVLACFSVVLARFFVMEPPRLRSADNIASLIPQYETASASLHR